MRYAAFCIAVLLIAACGKTEVPAQASEVAPSADTPAPAEPAARSISLSQVFDGGQYRCTVDTPEGTLTLKTRDGKFRFEGESAQGPFTVIMELGDTATMYTYVPQQDKWFKISVAGGETQRGPIITRENAAQYPKHECVKASNPDSEFSVPADKVIDQSSMLAGLGQT